MRRIERLTAAAKSALTIFSPSPSHCKESSRNVRFDGTVLDSVITGGGGPQTDAQVSAAARKKH